VDTWWFEETKLLIAFWSEQAVQHAQQETRMGQNKPRNGKLRVFENCLIRCCCFRKRIFLLLAFEASFASLLTSKSIIAVNIMATVRWSANLFSTLDCKVILPSLFEFSQM